MPRVHHPWIFLLIALATLTVLSAWGIFLEKATGALLDKLVRVKPKPAV